MPSAHQLADPKANSHVQTYEGVVINYREGGGGGKFYPYKKKGRGGWAGKVFDTLKGGTKSVGV